MGKRLLLAAVLLTLFSVGKTAAASTVVRTGETVAIDDNQSVTGDFYGLGQTVILSGEISGDTYVAGGVVTYNGSVLEDLIMLGGTVSLHASSSEDVRVVAGDVTIAEDVAGDLVILAGKAKILSTATIAGNVLLFANEALLEGEIKGEVLGRVDRLYIDGAIGQQVDVSVDELTLGDQAALAQDLRYQSRTELSRASNASVAGTISRNDVVPTYLETASLSLRAVLFITFTLTFMILVATLSLYLIARQPVTRFARRAITRPEINGLIGGLLFILLPAALLALSVTVVGVWLAIIAFTGFIALSFIALPLMSVVLGTYLAKFTKAKGLTGETIPIFYILGAAALLVGAVFVPIVGPLTIFMVYLVVIGTMARLLVERLRR